MDGTRKHSTLTHFQLIVNIVLIKHDQDCSLTFIMLIIVTMTTNSPHLTE